MDLYYNSKKINLDGEGVPAGGTTGQILAKKTDADFDTYWVNMSSGTGSVVYQTANVPKGTIVAWYGEEKDIPDGWHICDGTDGTPDYRGRFLLGASSDYAPGDTGGEETHKLTTSEMPMHGHQQRLPAPGGSGTVLQYIPSAAGSTSGRSISQTATTSINNGVVLSSVNAGSSESHNNMPPYAAIIWIMKMTDDAADSFENFGVVTQAEYDALDDDRKENGMWFVPGPSVASGGSSNVYSTEETVVGTWIDGRPIYAKTFVAASSTSATTNRQVLATDVAPNFDMLIEGTIRAPVNGKGCTVGFYANNFLYMYVEKNDHDNADFVCYGTGPDFRGIALYVTIEYIKTTDAATASIPAIIPEIYEGGIDE